MKSITNGTETLRVSDEVAERKVTKGNFRYISKSEHKSLIENSPKIDPIVLEQKDKKSSSKLSKRLKLKEKQK